MKQRTHRLRVAAAERNATEKRTAETLNVNPVGISHRCFRETQPLTKTSSEVVKLVDSDMWDLLVPTKNGKTKDR